MEDRFLLVAVCNTQYTGKGMRLAPEADSGAGKLDVVLVRQATRRQMLRLFRKALDGSHMSLPFVEHHRVELFRLESEGGDCLNLGGELKGSTPQSIEVTPGALNILV